MKWWHSMLLVFGLILLVNDGLGLRKTRGKKWGQMLNRSTKRNNNNIDPVADSQSQNISAGPDDDFEPDFTMQTNGESKFQKVGNIKIVPTEGLLFSVKSCGKVKIQLATPEEKGRRQKKTKTTLVEVVVGVTSSIWETTDGGPVQKASALTSNLLSCDKSGSFWIKVLWNTWNNVTVQFGVGSNITSNVYTMAASFTRIKQFPNIYVGSDEGKADWDIKEVNVGYQATTYGDRKYHELLVIGVTLRRNVPLTFKIKACDEFHLQIGVRKQIERYLLIIGHMVDNDTEISKIVKIGSENNETISEVNTPDIKLCDAFQQFWISYSKSGVLTIGKGSVVAQGTFLTATIDKPVVGAFSKIRFSSWDGDAEWLFDPIKRRSRRPNRNRDTKTRSPTDLSTLTTTSKPLIPVSKSSSLPASKPTPDWNSQTGGINRIPHWGLGPYGNNFGKPGGLNPYLSGARQFICKQRDLFCQNKGVCVELLNKRHCLCTEGYTGEHCEKKDVNEDGCPPFKCIKHCPWGYQSEKIKGALCYKCDCAQDPCKAKGVNCKQDEQCIRQRKTCDTFPCPPPRARCKGQPPCNKKIMKKCKTKCPYGYKVDGNGCPKCLCNDDPCSTTDCGDGRQCVIEKVRCFASDTSCFASRGGLKAHCRSKNKPGTCPNLRAGQNQDQNDNQSTSEDDVLAGGNTEKELISRYDRRSSRRNRNRSKYSRWNKLRPNQQNTDNVIGASCEVECKSDLDCRGMLKCCSNGCGMQCILPSYEESSTCAVQRENAIESGKDWDVPTCRENGLYAEIQCKFNEEQTICYCVDPDTGSPIRGTFNVTTEEDCKEKASEKICPEMDCNRNCTFGYQNDDYGCTTCQCARSPCEEEDICPVDQVCEVGHDIDCESTDCFKTFCNEPEWSEASCEHGAPLRIRTGSLLICQPGSKTQVCPDSYSCSANQDNTGFAVCCPKEGKPGVCPDAGSQVSFTSKVRGRSPPPWHRHMSPSTCSDTCHKDTECEGDMKCCATDCNGHTCVLPSINKNSTCQTMLEASLIALSVKSDSQVFIPRCYFNGTWQSIQCHDNFGLCWCVNGDGEEISGTKVRGLPDCSKSNKVEAAAQHMRVCAPGEKVHRCNAQMCRYKMCASNPAAVCRINPCDGCNTEFYNTDDNTKITDCSKITSDVIGGKCLPRKMEFLKKNPLLDPSYDSMIHRIRYVNELYNVRSGGYHTDMNNVTSSMGVRSWSRMGRGKRAVPAPGRGGAGGGGAGGRGGAGGGGAGGRGGAGGGGAGGRGGRGGRGPGGRGPGGGGGRGGPWGGRGTSGSSRGGWLGRGSGSWNRSPGGGSGAWGGGRTGGSRWLGWSGRNRNGGVNTTSFGRNARQYMSTWKQRSDDFCPNMRDMRRQWRGKANYRQLACTQQCATDTDCMDIGSPGKEFVCCSTGCGRICSPVQTKKDEKEKCMLPRDNGRSCGGFNKQGRRQYYYNSETEECEAFDYYGSGSNCGNDNRFFSIEDCRSTCQDIYPFVKPVELECDDYSHFKTEQCHEDLCWCADPKSGKAIAGTLTNKRQGKLVCHQATGKMLSGRTLKPLMCPDGSVPQICDSQCVDAKCYRKSSMQRGLRRMHSMMLSMLNKCYADPCNKCKVSFTDRAGEDMECGDVPECEQPKDSGSCSDKPDVRYYFDKADKRCKQFTWGGCGGNANNFFNEQQCMSKCGGTLCEAGQEARICDDVCDDATCDGDPEAICIPDPCTCKPVFINVLSGASVQCNTPRTLCERLQEESKKAQILAGDLGDSIHLMECEKDGNFKKVQCLDAHQVCWCVDDKGKELDGSRTIMEDVPDGPGDDPTSICKQEKKIAIGWKFKFDQSFSKVENDVAAFQRIVGTAIAAELRFPVEDIAQLKVYDDEGNIGIYCKVVVIKDGQTELDLSSAADLLYGKIMRGQFTVTFNSETFTALGKNDGVKEVKDASPKENTENIENFLVDDGDTSPLKGAAVDGSAGLSTTETIIVGVISTVVVVAVAIGTVFVIMRIRSRRFDDGQTITFQNHIDEPEEIRPDEITVGGLSSRVSINGTTSQSAS